jgi:hypothetical protein
MYPFLEPYMKEYPLVGEGVRFTVARKEIGKVFSWAVANDPISVLQVKIVEESNGDLCVKCIVHSNYTIPDYTVSIEVADVEPLLSQAIAWGARSIHVVNIRSVATIGHLLANPVGIIRVEERQEGRFFVYYYPKAEPWLADTMFPPCDESSQLYPLLPLVVARPGRLYIGEGLDIVPNPSSDIMNEYQCTLSVVAKENPYKNVAVGLYSYDRWWESIHAVRLLPNINGGQHRDLKKYVAGPRVLLAIALLEAYTPRGLRSPLRVVDKDIVRRMVDSLYSR